jgi:hypothetical protein
MNEPVSNSEPAAFLFSEEELGLEKVGDPTHTGTGVSTGERLFKFYPKVYQSIVYLLSQGTGIREIKRITGVHHRTIEAVGIREGQTIDTARRELGARALRVASMGVERLEEIVSSDFTVKAGELAMVVGVLTDKAQLLTGGVTQRVERVDSVQIAAGLEKMLSELPLAEAREIGCGSGNVLPIADAADSDPGVTQRELDSRSGVEIPSDSVKSADATTDATTGTRCDGHPTAPAPTPVGGEGVGPAETGQTADQSVGSEIFGQCDPDSELSPHP